MSLRILGGTFRGRSLMSPKGQQTRPTLAIMRKSLFDILQTQIEGASFLDLYAGSGAMGFEALSRGASHATFVETSRLALASIRDNINSLHVQQQSSILSIDALLALKKLAKQGQSFDIAYVDPPYSAAHCLQEILHFFDTHPILNPGGRLFLEESAPAALSLHNLPLASLCYLNSRTFSRSVFHQYIKKPGL